MSSDYTPTTEEVHDGYACFAVESAKSYAKNHAEKIIAEDEFNAGLDQFNRWLASYESELVGKVVEGIEIWVSSSLQVLITNLRDAGFALASEEAKRITELILEDIAAIARGRK